MTFTKKIIDFIQNYLHILSPEDKETLQSIHMRLEHIKNLNITFNQMETNKEMSTTYAAAAADDVVDCEKEQHFKYIQQKLVDEHDALQIMTSYQIL